MEKLLNTGRWIFPLSFLLYVGLHFGQPETGASFIPDWIPFPLFWNYFTGICIIAFIVSTVIGKYDKLATVLMALYVFLVLLIIHVPNAATSENDMLNIFRNIIVIGALFLFAKYAARDKRIIG
ncbi:MAG: hypothetical protein R2879_07765 [Saprospiraceae bacterium]